MQSILFVQALVALGLTGCGGGDSSSHVDAPPLPACTGAAYDPCSDTTNSTDCTGGAMCRLFSGDGYTECSPTCDGTHPCPNDKDGNAVACNMMGRCKASPNGCMR